MINMGHCRFENTYLALCECVDALIDEDWNDLSESEQKYAKQLEEKCQELIQEMQEKRSVINNF